MMQKCKINYKAKELMCPKHSEISFKPIIKEANTSYIDEIKRIE
jgi:hypothetical protein